MKKSISILAVMLIAAFCLSGCNSVRYDFDLGEYLTIGTYKGIELKQSDIDKKYDENITSVLESHSETKEITDRGVEKEDKLNVNYTAKVDEELIDSNTEEAGLDIVIGDDDIIEGLDEKILGTEKGKTVTATITLPDNYSKKDYAGKEATYEVTVNKITATIVPEFNDEFVKEHYSDDYSSAEEMKTDYIKSVKESLAWEKLIESTVINKYPEKYIKKYYNTYVDYYNANYQELANMYGTNVQTIMSMYGTTTEAMYKNCADMATSEVRNEMLTLTIARAENFEITDEIYNAKTTELLEEYGDTYDSVKALEKAITQEGIKITIYNEMALDFILTNLVIK